MKKELESNSRKRNGCTRCAPAKRTPLLAGLKHGNGSVHCLEGIEKGKTEVAEKRLKVTRGSAMAAHVARQLREPHS
ncbi:hypothetical protein LQ50_14275 [Halalkalibacter okhensis]|uniref:Uncharacterized protein n=1 Tax=Halalkalibacter okhensis TaxID=333138 RepID=A0A0B0IFD5_9BACI|nr:hypothetical protein LQ50_14275 [Halalkalibacter okhensis]